MFELFYYITNISTLFFSYSIDHLIGYPASAIYNYHINNIILLLIISIISVFIVAEVNEESLFPFPSAQSTTKRFFYKFIQSISVLTIIYIIIMF